MFIFNTKTLAFSNMAHQVVGQIPPHLEAYDISPYRGLALESKFLLFGVLPDDTNTSEIWSFDMFIDSWENLELSEELKELELHTQLLEHVPGKGYCIFGYKELHRREIDIKQGGLPQN
ncbi:hypothetical protein FRC03_006817 [Tulasnella sp. 419]|nr:hypothetical protein FRC03_006817 [Tulasnella sp. 419]